MRVAIELEDFISGHEKLLGLSPFDLEKQTPVRTKLSVKGSPVREVEAAVGNQEIP